jgi:cation transport regulator
VSRNARRRLIGGEAWYFRPRHAACGLIARKEEPMPYSKIADLPKEQVDQYSHHQKEAFLEAFNSAIEQYGEESRAFAVAHAAAKRTPKKDPTPGD